MGICCWTRI